MDYRFAVAVVLLAMTSQVWGQQNQQATQCQRTFLASAMSCVQNGSINFNHLTYVTSNGTTGQMPPEGIQQFQLRACNLRLQIDQCGQLVSSRLVNSSLCINALDKQQLMLKAKNIFGEYDRVCAHPCRYTLLDELRQCFSYNNLDPRTFIDGAWGQGAVIGTNEEQVFKFCNNRQMLMQCIRQKSQMCPDAATVFYRIGMDILSMEKGIETLCQAPRVYLAGIGCFTSPTPEVKMCLQDGNMKMQNMKLLLQQTMAEQQFKLQTCSVRLQQVDCELGAWARRQHDRCDKAVIGLRNELECKILPSLCMQTHPQLYQRLCNPMNFHLDERERYASAGVVMVTWSTLAILVMAAIFSAE
ncbi:uncharacterized protein [Haliotis asinina]|uniref:uncharacterized protein n=1 Tax=Haliotis asinina TaxID=109174 RepID=UPI003531832E